jgi:hypothetical protein
LRLRDEPSGTIAVNRRLRPLRMSRQIIGHCLPLTFGHGGPPALGSADAGEDAVTSGVGFHGDVSMWRLKGQADCRKRPGVRG